MLIISKEILAFVSSVSVIYPTCYFFCKSRLLHAVYFENLLIGIISSYKMLCNSYNC